MGEKDPTRCHEAERGMGIGGFLTGAAVAGGILGFFVPGAGILTKIVTTAVGAAAGAYGGEQGAHGMSDSCADDGKTPVDQGSQDPGSAPPDAGPPTPVDAGGGVPAGTGDEPGGEPPEPGGGGDGDPCACSVVPMMLGAAIYGAVRGTQAKDAQLEVAVITATVIGGSLGMLAFDNRQRIAKSLRRLGS